MNLSITPSLRSNSVPKNNQSKNSHMKNPAFGLRLILSPKQMNETLSPNFHYERILAMVKSVVAEMVNFDVKKVIEGQAIQDIKKSYVEKYGDILDDAIKQIPGKENLNKDSFFTIESLFKDFNNTDINLDVKFSHTYNPPSPLQDSEQFFEIKGKSGEIEDSQMFLFKKNSLERQFQCLINTLMQKMMMNPISKKEVFSLGELDSAIAMLKKKELAELCKKDIVIEK